MTHHRCIAIGASAGGFNMVVDIISQLPEDIPAPVFLVMHVPASHKSYLPEILQKAGHLPAIHPKDGMDLKPGIVYVAPPDHHLLVDNSRVAVKKGPRRMAFVPRTTRCSARRPTRMAQVPLAWFCRVH